MALTRYQRISYRLFGRHAQRAAEGNPHLPQALEKGHVQVRTDVYLSSAYLTIFIAFTATLLPVIMLVGALSLGLLQVPTGLLFLIAPLPGVLAGTLYLTLILLPDLNASRRARDIDAKLPYALNYISTMASAGATPERIFTSLSKQPIYGEVANEAALISRDLRVLGKDIVTALNIAIGRSPSARFQDLLQGSITALTSGSDLKTYYLNKAEQFMSENRQVQKGFLESLGVLAESFVVVVVAAPLFIIVILSVMTTFGGDANEMLQIGYIVILTMLPLSQAGFAYTIKQMTPEA